MTKYALNVFNKNSRDNVSKSRTRGGHSSEISNQFLKPWYTLGFLGSLNTNLKSIFESDFLVPLYGRSAF